MCKAVESPKKVFVVGGFDSMVFGNFQRNLNENGIEIGGHYQKGDVLRAIPADCDGVVILYDMIGHSVINQAVEMAEARKLPLVRVPRKWSVAQAHLRKMGFLPDVPASVSVADVPTPASVPAPPSRPTTLLDKARWLLENDPGFYLRPAQTADLVLDDSPGAERAEAERAVLDAMAEFKKSLDDRTRAGAERKREAVKTWVVRWFHRAAQGEADLPTFDSFRKLGKDIFGVVLNWDIAREARISAYGAWAEDIVPAAKILDWFARKETGHDLIDLLEKGTVEGVKIRDGWMTSKKAVENWLGYCQWNASKKMAATPVPEPTPAPAPEPIPVPEPPAVSAPPAPTFDAETLKAIVSDAVKSATAPFEEQIALLQLHVEALEQSIKRLENAELRIVWEGVAKAVPRTPEKQGG